MKAFTVRLEDTLAKRLELIARATGNSINDELTEAVRMLIKHRMKDPGVREQLEQVLAEERRVADELVAMA